MTEADKFLRIWLQCSVILVFNRLHNVRCITFLTFNSVDHVIPRMRKRILKLCRYFLTVWIFFYICYQNLKFITQCVRYDKVKRKKKYHAYRNRLYQYIIWQKILFIATIIRSYSVWSFSTWSSETMINRDDGHSGRWPIRTVANRYSGQSGRWLIRIMANRDCNQSRLWSLGTVVN